MLKELIDKGYVFQKEGESDRRQRLLHLTEAGEELRQRLMGPQMNRIRRAVALPEGNVAELYRKVLYHMVSPANRDAVRDWIDRAKPGGEEYQIHEIQLLTIVAGQTAMQLENTRLYEEEVNKQKLEEEMRAAAKNLDFETAARLRDELFDLKAAMGDSGAKGARGRR